MLTFCLLDGWSCRLGYVDRFRLVWWDIIVADAGSGSWHAFGRAKMVQKRAIIMKRPSFNICGHVCLWSQLSWKEQVDNFALEVWLLEVCCVGSIVLCVCVCVCVCECFNISL